MLTFVFYYNIFYYDAWPFMKIIMPRPKLTPFEKLQRKKKVLEYDRERKRLKRMNAKFQVAEQTKSTENPQEENPPEEIHHNELLTFLLGISNYNEIVYIKKKYDIVFIQILFLF